MKITQEQLIRLAYGAECFFRGREAGKSYRNQDLAELGDLAEDLRIAAINGQKIEVSDD